MTTPRDASGTAPAPAGFTVSAPQLSLPTGGGAIRGMGEKLTTNPVTGTATLTIPITTSPGRAGFGPELALSYDSGSGNGPFGLGWKLGVPAITRKTDAGLPRYDDTDVFTSATTDDLVPELDDTGARRSQPLDDYTVQRYFSRVEGAFTRIERWTHRSGEVHWRSISRDNLLSIYGSTPQSQIAAPDGRIFSWLLTEVRDDRGQAMLYDYVGDDATNVAVTAAHEQHRGGPESPIRQVNRYLKRIRYGNETSLLDDAGRRPRFLDAAAVATCGWMFEVVFDYGDHDDERPRPPATPEVWPARADPFSTYRAGFEVRTYRLCRRVLMFHHFPDVAEVGADCLVRSTDFEYASATYSMLTRAQHFSYRWSGTRLDTAALPPLDFGYQQAAIDPTVHTIAGLPAGVDAGHHQWADLDGEGLPGVLTEESGCWLYHRNRSTAGDVAFGSAEVARTVPAYSALASQQLLDLDGDGQLDLVDLHGPTPGFYERTADGDWTPWRPFEQLPNVDWSDPQLRMLDLTGDGRVDVMRCGEQGLTWYAARGELGFDAPSASIGPLDDVSGPRPLLSEPAETLMMADLSGDGLTDVVRVRNGEICYWPNLGYGRFGPRVVMDGAPVFDSPERFDASRIRLADVDGSGPTDILYLGTDGVQLHLNQSGNAWTTAEPLSNVPVPDDATTVSVVDLFGSGTSCIVWSSKFGGPVRYLDLQSGGKPHLLSTMSNNSGLTTVLDYTPSTQFYVRDRADGRQWATRLPFPVHCVSRVEVRDKWRQTCFVTTYSYHHGCYDGVEREFRGFGRVEQIDAESYGSFADANVGSPYVTNDSTLHQPPVHKISWFHTGGDHDLSGEYQAPLPPGPSGVLPVGDLSADEWRQAMRAAKGTLLREELYELDGDEAAAGRCVHTRLFSTTTHRTEVRRLQRSADSPHGVFLAVPSETFAAHYELDLRRHDATVDPRVTHTLHLRVDDYGNPVQTVSVGYPRSGRFHDDALDDATVARIAQQQDRMHVSYVENRYTDGVDDVGEDHRLPVACETKSYEVWGIAPGDGPWFTRAELLTERWDDLDVRGYHQLQTVGGPTRAKRLVEHHRTLFVDDIHPGLNRPAAFRSLPRMGLVYETYQLAFTDALLNALLGDRVTPEVAARLTDPRDGGYLTGDPLAAAFSAEDTAGQYWVRSGTAGFGADPLGDFFRPSRYTDAFGAETRQDFDERRLFIARSADARGNTQSVLRFDYRVLAAASLRDHNDNVSELAFDVIGVPTAFAVLGKGDEADTLDGLVEPSAPELARFFDQADLDDTAARRWLGGASARYLYHLGAHRNDDDSITWAAEPAGACTIRRERHLNSTDGTTPSPLQAAFEYSDGTSRPLMRKSQAPPAQPGEPLRWVADGLIVANNKGNAVEQFDPFFSPPDVGHRFAHSAPAGLATVTYYDAVDRPVRVELPDGTLRRVEFSPWQVTRFDENDTVEESRWYAERSAPGASTPDARAAQLSAGHADTPAVAVLDGLGREVVAIAHNRVADDTGGVRDEKLVTLTRYDVKDRPLWTRDARGNLIVQLIHPVKPSSLTDEPVADSAELAPPDSAPGYDMLGNALCEHSHDGGDRWRISDANGQNAFSWNDFETGGRVVRRMHRTDYDSLRRPTAQWLHADGGEPSMVDKFEYIDAADGLVDAKERNMCRRLHRHFDQAGLTTTVAADFAGNVLEVRRRLTGDHRSVVTDWTADADSLLDDEEFTQTSSYDALNRVVRLYGWHRGVGARTAVREPRYDQSGLLTATDLVIGATKTATGHIEDASAQRHTVIESIRYDARGLRRSITHGNGTATLYDRDPATQRLRRLRTTRAGFSPAFPDAAGTLRDSRVVQNLHCLYDAVGNTVEVRDDAYEPAFFDNQRVEARTLFAYDPLYRLTSASGRENGQATAPRQFDAPPVAVDYPVTDPSALRNYTEDFDYDAAGNLLRIRHHAGAEGNWTRTMDYRTDGNQILTATVGGRQPERFRHDVNGNLLNPGGSLTDELSWDYRDLLGSHDRGGGGSVYYSYDAGKQRIRKVGDDGEVRWTRIYLGGLEVYRRYRGGVVVEEVETIEVFDGRQRILLVEDVLRSDDHRVVPGPSFRYQYENQTGSATLELTEHADVLSYEEYYPHGSTAYRSVSKTIRATAKRYRFLGKERDEESGLSYHGARYYAPWLARWVTADPAGILGGLNRYVYAHDNPIELRDDDGKWPQFVDDFAKNPLGATKQLAQTAGKVAVAYAEKRIADLSDKAMMLNPITATVQIGVGLVAKGTQEVKEIHQAYTDSGGGAKGAVHATGRALVGSVAAHTGDAVAKARKAGGGTGKAIDAGLGQLADETKDLNPLYHLGVATVGAPVATIEALQRDDPTSAGRHLAEGQSSFEEAAQALVPIALEAGLLSDAAVGARGAATGGNIPGELSFTKKWTPEQLAQKTKTTMTKLGVKPEHQGIRAIGEPAYVHVEDPSGMTIGRNVAGHGISIDSGILREFPQPWEEWSRADLPTRMEAITQHEHWEMLDEGDFETKHNRAVELGHRGEYTLKVGQKARDLLRTMPFFR